MSQGPGTTGMDPDLPYGGPAITPGSWNVGQSPGVRRLTGSAVCSSGAPCVITGENDQHRNSLNDNATNLGQMDNSCSYTNFGLAYLYPVTNAAFDKNNEPVIPQPLYITDVTVPTPPSGMCNGGTSCNILLVATLADWIYAFDTSTPPATGSPNYLWTLNIATAPGHCTSSGGPFNNNQNGFPGVQNLPYYGVVATPVVDVAPTTPTMFVVSGCVTSPTSTTIQWYLDAINVTNGGVIATQALTASTFNAANQVARAALLLTHPAGTEDTFIYVTFGDGVREIGAENDSGGSSYRYTGAEFLVPYSYSSSAFSSPTAFFTTCTGAIGGCSTSVFPSVFAGLGGRGYPTGPAGPAGPTGCTTGCCATDSCCTLPTPPSGTDSLVSSCSTGGNWAANGGGCWMSSRGAASSGNADVLIACGNGAFACASTGDGQTGCTSASGVTYWGESAMEFPTGNTSSPTVPIDFYAAYTQTYTCTGTGCSPSWDPSPAAYQTEELSRVDQDLGTGGMTVLTQTGDINFMVTADKAGFVYVMPPPSGEISGSSLGMFQPGDAGLTGSGLSYSTQSPFRASRLPNGTTSVCPSVNAVGMIAADAPSCDEVHEIAYDPKGNLIFIWPAGETVMAYQGTLTTGTTTNYAFGSRIDPCGGSVSCTNFPASGPSSAGGAMGLAVDSTTTNEGDGCTSLPCTNLWAIVPQTNTSTHGGGPEYNLGSLYAYNVGSSGALGYLWSSPTTPTACSGGPSVGSWYTTSFTEPTLADVTESGTATGAVYVPTVCSVSGSTVYTNCAEAGTSASSGVLVFANCPGN